MVTRQLRRLSFEELNEEDEEGSGNGAQQWSDDEQYLELIEKAKTLDLQRLIKNDYIGGS